MEKRYRVVITEIIDGLPDTAREWKELFSDEVWEKMTEAQQEAAGGSQRNYVTYPSEKTESREIYNQSIADLDLPAVIKAVNKL